MDLFLENLQTSTKICISSKEMFPYILSFFPYRNQFVLVKRHTAILQVISLQMIKAENVTMQMEQPTETTIISKRNKKFNRPTFSFVNI
jgi:hypothetical protein